jgi:hypothetical protein
MYDCSEKKTCARYGPEGDKVLAVYKTNSWLPRIIVEPLMVAKLKEVLPDARKQNRMTHVRGAGEVVNPNVTAIDISVSTIPENRRDAFIAAVKARPEVVGFMCKTYDPAAYHIEIATDPRYQTGLVKDFCN